MSWHGQVLVRTPCYTVGEVRRRLHLLSPRRHQVALHPPQCCPQIPTTQGGVQPSTPSPLLAACKPNQWQKNPSTASTRVDLAGTQAALSPSSPPTQGAEDGERGVQLRGPCEASVVLCGVVWVRSDAKCTMGLAYYCLVLKWVF